MADQVESYYKTKIKRQAEYITSLLSKIGWLESDLRVSEKKLKKAKENNELLQSLLDEVTELKEDI